MEEKWILARRKADFNRLSKRYGVSPYLIRLMVNRGVKEEDMDRYLNGSIEELHPPFLLKGMEQAVELLLQAAREGVKVAIASDFDCDGIFAGMVLKEGLEELGIECEIYTPDRITEGYGLNNRIVEEAKEAGAGLVLTCDNGITAGDSIRYAKQLGLSVVVTDHHEVPFDIGEDGARTYHLPEADVIVNPKQPDCNYPFKGICGSAVAYKLVEAIYERAGIKTEKKRKLLTYVAIATITDVMELIDENRIIVKYGLELLAKCDNIGIKAIMEINGIAPSQINASHIAYVIGPCFNAAGRLDTVKMAFTLLNCKEWEQALRLAKDLKELNDKRKEMTAKGYEEACACIEEDGLGQDKVLLVELEDCHESLVGIIAGRLRERYHKPSFVFVETENGCKGSGRSIEAYSMFEELSACSDLLTRFGGHPMAAGLSIEKKDIGQLRKRLNEQANLTKEDLTPTVQIDIDLPIHYVTTELIEELKRLEPFGKGNPKPVFAERRFQILSARLVGRELNHIKMTVKNEKGCRMEALYFGEGATLLDSIKEKYGEEQVNNMMMGKPNQVIMAFTYYPSVNAYNGYEMPQIIIQNYTHASP